MADTVASQTIVDGNKTVVMKFTNISDGTGESAVAKVDASALSGAPSKLSIKKVWATTAGMSVDILFNATANVLALHIPQDMTMEQDYSGFGGISNNAGSGVNGDILFTTIGHTAADRYTIILEMTKS